MRQLLANNSIRRVAMCALASVKGRRQHLCVNHDKGKVKKRGEVMGGGKMREWGNGGKEEKSGRGREEDREGRREWEDGRRTEGEKGRGVQ